MAEVVIPRIADQLQLLPAQWLLLRTEVHSVEHFQILCINCVLIGLLIASRVFSADPLVRVDSVTIVLRPLVCSILFNCSIFGILLTGKLGQVSLNSNFCLVVLCLLIAAVLLGG